MIEVDSIFSDIDLNPIHLAAEFVVVCSVFIAHRRTGPEADVAGFVRGEDQWLRLLYTALTTFFAVDLESSRAAFRKSAPS
jgi:hypothetical protein